MCVCDGQSDRHQAAGNTRVDGPRQADGWVAEAGGSRSAGRQDDGCMMSQIDSGEQT